MKQVVAITLILAALQVAKCVNIYQYQNEHGDGCLCYPTKEHELIHNEPDMAMPLSSEDNCATLPEEWSGRVDRTYTSPDLHAMGGSQDYQIPETLERKMSSPERARLQHHRIVFPHRILSRPVLPFFPHYQRIQ